MSFNTNRAIEENRAVIGVRAGAIKVHVDPQCSFYPEKPSQLTDDDKRRSRLQLCSWCRDHSEHDAHPGLEVR